VVVGTPGRMLDLLDQKVLDLSVVRTVVLDEADEMLSMGFVEDIESILAKTPATRQTALFSATLPSRIRQLADKYMNDPQTVLIQREQVTVAAIEQRYYLVNQSDKTAALARLFEMEDITSALIFARTRAGTSELANALTQRGFQAEVLNGDLSQESRERTLNRFRQNQIKVLVATDVAARGLDIDDISHVFNFDLPEDPEIYVHRIGRTGRAGKTGIAISLVAPREKRLLKDIEYFIKQKLERATLPTEEDILLHRQTQLLDQVKVWLGRGRYSKERELVARLVEEGHDPMEIAAASLKIARLDEKQRPIAPVKEVTEYPSRKTDGVSRRREGKPERREKPFGEKRARRGSESTISHESGMVRLSLSLGKDHGLRPADVVGTLAHHADIPGHTLGRIYIEDGHTLVDVPEELVGKVLSRNGDYRFKRQLMVVERA
jgi:ATP-dependent RNA helicase DeaD